MQQTEPLGSAVNVVSCTQLIVVDSKRKKGRLGRRKKYNFYTRNTLAVQANNAGTAAMSAQFHQQTSNAYLEGDGLPGEGFDEDLHIV